jgi:hypothetical protein
MSLDSNAEIDRSARATRQPAMPEEFLDKADHRALIRAHRAADARRSSQRRRLVDPATCERDYSTAEIEFMQAMHAYKKESGRPFPTWGEVLAVSLKLGYRKPAPLAACISS